MNKIPVRAALAAALLPAWAVAQEPDVQSELKDLRERIDMLEEQQAETSEKVSGRALLQAFQATTFDFGGHVTSVFSAADTEGVSRAGHVVSLVELYLRAKVSDEWSVFATPGFYIFNGGLLDNPGTAQQGDPLYTADSSTVENQFLSRCYAEWRPNDQFGLQGGIVGSPHGTTNREYFIPARTIAAGNLHTRVFLVNQLYPQYLEGLKASGKLTIGDTDWIGYDLYVGTQTDLPAEALGGARVGYTFGDLGLTIAGNYGAGKRPGGGLAGAATNVPLLQSPFTAGYNFGREYQFAGLDIDWRSGDFIGKVEAYYSDEKGFRPQRAFSGEATWFAAAEFGISYRFDYYDAGSDLSVFLPVPAVVDRGIATEHVIGFCYNPNAAVRLRLDLHHLNLPNSDVATDFANLSWSISF